MPGSEAPGQDAVPGRCAPVELLDRSLAIGVRELFDRPVDSRVGNVADYGEAVNEALVETPCNQTDIR